MSKYLEESYNEALKENTELIEQNQRLRSKLEAAYEALVELERYTAPEYPFKSTETIAEFHTLIGMALQQIRE